MQMFMVGWLAGWLAGWQAAASIQQILLHDKQHGLLCPHVQWCMAEPHMMLASLHYKAHQGPWPGVMKTSFMLATRCMWKRLHLDVGS